MSKRAKSKLNTTGPAIKPMGPKSPIRQNEKQDNKRVDMRPFFIKIGDSKLSESPTRATPQTAKPMAPA